MCVCFSSLETNKKSNKSQAYDVRSRQTSEANEIRRTNAKLFQNGNKIVNWKPFSDYEQNDSYFTDGKKMRWPFARNFNEVHSIPFDFGVSITR